VNECSGPATHEHLPGVPRLCDTCWHPIGWGELTWQLIATVPTPEWICLHTACWRAGRERSAAA
jgi:hypothetical protein